ncbi:MAG: bifunctional nicotinamidase/pyrazinamidase [Balneolaceae bacterium]|nr:MAG: bifunctional nicotinamidase/pyrazinamidase [Balneolaceae bacterium]
MKALLIVDIQNDFCPGGALAVPDGDKIIPVVNRLSKQFDHILITQDWHPGGHHSFASSHDGKQPFDTAEMPYGDQVLWPDHCIQGTPGADFHPALDTTSAQLIIRKGFRKEIDSYSGFYENDHKTGTGLTGYLRDRGFDSLYIAGLASDFCVKWTALDAVKEGFGVTVIRDAVAGIDIEGSVNKAWEEMESAGVQFSYSNDLLTS